MTKDLTKGSPIRLIISFMIPVLLGNVIQQLYSMADAVIVGQAISTQALGGVGATGHLVFFVIGFSTGLGSGFTVLTSQCYGAGDREGVKRSVAVAFVLTAVTAVVLTAIATPLAMPVLKLLKTPETLLPYAYEYLFITFIGMTGTLFYNLLAAILRAIGDSKVPLFFLIMSAVLNVGLDLLFIIAFKWGVAGAAWATVVSQAVSAACCAIYSFKKYELLRFNRSHLKGSGALTLKQLRLGLPLGLDNSLCAIGLIIQQSLVNAFGEIAVSALSAAYKIDNVFIQINSAFGLTFVSYTGQNVGANRLDRVKKGIRSGWIIAPIMAVAEIVLIMLLIRPMIALFIPSPSEEIMWYAKNYMYAQALTYVIQMVFFMYRNALQGMGKSGIAMAIGIVETVCRSLAVFCFASVLGFTAVGVSNPFAWAVALAISAVAYYLALRKAKN